jgi:hypothetical protein
MQSTLPSDSKLDISNAMHARHLSSLTVFAIAGNTNKHHCRVPPEGLVFSMSNDVIYGGPDFNIMSRLDLGYQLKEGTGIIQQTTV